MQRCKSSPGCAVTSSSFGLVPAALAFLACTFTAICQGNAAECIDRAVPSTPRSQVLDSDLILMAEEHGAFGPITQTDADSVKEQRWKALVWGFRSLTHIIQSNAYATCW